MTDILVFGHQNPDTDSIAAAIAYANLLRAEGMDAEAVALGSANDETLYALEKFGFDQPRIIEKASGESQRVALVDHNEFQQSVSDISELEIYSVVDHHKIANFQTASPLYYRAEPLGSTCSILTKMYREAGVEISKEIAGLMVSAIISDTLLFKSPTCSEKDVEIGKDLAEIAGIDLEDYGLSMLKAGANPDKKTADEIIESDSKSFEFEDIVIRVGQVNVVDINDILKRKDEIIGGMDKFIDQENYSAYMLVVTDIINSNSVGLIRGQEAANIADAFGLDLKEDQIEMPGVVSRKKQVVPPISQKYS